MNIPTDALGDTILLKKDEFNEKTQEEFHRFLDEYTTENNKQPYVEVIGELESPERNTLTVDFQHIEQFSAPLADSIAKNYYRVFPYLCRALANFAGDHVPNFKKVSHLRNKRLYLSFENVAHRLKLRQLVSESVGRLLRITAQVVRTHAVHPELCQAVFTCEDCNTDIGGVEQQFKYTQPTKCLNAACQNRTRFALAIRKSTFVDFQKVRVQETQSELPRGSVPRSLEVILRAECVEMPQAGDRCDFIGTLIVIPDVSQISVPGARAESSARHRGREGFDNDGLKGLKSLGVRDLNYKLAFLACTVLPTTPMFGGRFWKAECVTPEIAKDLMSPAELAKIDEMASDKNLYSNLVNSLFPTIHGNEEIKRGILLMLFGGVSKSTKEGTNLRGDINVCIVGDPSTAKSQFLKQVSEFVPRAVYTSGKASSAAGLTAAVVRDDESSEFVIEAGALMLADNGVCCIDEFDKMDPRDQVAIHEAMEQQTISITKAGVKATLNARTSILAAANPTGGRYDRSKSLRQNITLSAPIMSRFDLFFILIDDGNEVTDYAIAQLITSLHCSGEIPSNNCIYTRDEIQRYLTFSRLWKPKLTQPAADLLVEEYKRMRLGDITGSSSLSSRVTVRQLESVVRLSEALARMYCSATVEPKHVKEATRLINKSILRVEQPDVDLDEEQLADVGDEIEHMEVDAPAPQTNGASKPVQSESQKLTFEDYKIMSNMLIVRIRQEEDVQSETSEGLTGMKRSDLVNWYLEQIGDEIDSQEELAERQSVVERVITRLIKRDGVLWEVPPADPKEQASSDDPFLLVHPNFVLDD